MAFFNAEEGTFIGNISGVVVGSVQRVISGAGSGIGNVGTYFADVNRLHREIYTLERALGQNTADALELVRLREENERLRAMLGLRESAAHFEVQAAEVIATNPGNWYTTFTINVGTSSGIAVRQPVITADNALAGYISAVGTNWARVTAISDPSAAVGVIISRSRDMGVVEGDARLGRRGQGRLSYISRDTNVIVGDYIETSGMGGIYPSGILIGRVVEVRPDPHGISQYGIVEMAVDFGRLSEVFVITNPPLAVEEYEGWVY